MGDSLPLTAGPASRSFTRFAWYLLAATLSLSVALIGYRVDTTDLRIPFHYDEDSLLIMPMVKATLERGSHWRTDRLGAPGIQEMHDFPVIDHLHFALIWLIGQFFPNATLTFNLYFLLGYPLAALMAMGVFRHFGLGFPASVVGGILYATTPFHQFRGQSHYFLSAYFFIPLTLMTILWIARGRVPFFPVNATGERRFRLTDRTTIVAILIAIGTASGGAYYAFFGCGLLLGAGLYAWVAMRTVKPMISAGLLIGVITAIGVAHHLPTFYYQYRFGRHTAPTERFAEEAEYYGMKIAQLLLPIEDHPLRPFAKLKARYNTFLRPVQSFSERYSLGLLASIGFMMLMARTVLPLKRESPYAELTALTVFGVLIGTLGGFGALFNLAISPQVRCYNRIAIYLVYFCLFAVLIWLETAARFLKSWLARKSSDRIAKAGAVGFWIAIGGLGTWDQLPYDWGQEDGLARLVVTQDRFRADGEFFGAVEGILKPETPGEQPMIFQLPFVQWPESPPTHQLASYEHARGYMHTTNIRWSFGCMKGRETDEWYRQTTALPPELMLEHLAAAGFEGLFIDKRGYSPGRADLLLAQLRRSLGGARQVVHADGNQIFFDIRDHRNWLRSQHGPGGWEHRTQTELNRVMILWLHGFASFEEPGYENRKRWGNKSAIAIFVNPTAETVTMKARFHLRTICKNPMELSIRGGELWTDDFTVDNSPITKNSVPIERTFVVPPGRHTVNFQATPPDTHTTNDPRAALYSIDQIKLE